MPFDPAVVTSRVSGRLRELAAPRTAFAAGALLIAAGLLIWPTYATLGPIAGDHSWRQAWTYSVAHNFIDESANFFYPRHDWRGDGPGIVGSEPPIYAYGLSILMRIFGDGAFVCRLPTWLFFLASLVVGFRMLRREGHTVEPWLFVLAAAFSPMALCDFKQIQPDPLSASLALIGAAVLRRSALEDCWRRFALGLAICTTSILVKPNALAVGPAMYLFANLGAKNSSLRRWGLTALAFAIPLVLWGSWHLWAEHLTRTYAGGSHLISIEIEPGEISDNLRNAGNWLHITLFLLPVYVSSWWLAPALLAGLALGFAPRYRVLSLCFLVWMLAMLLEAGAFSSRLRNNWYYCLLFLAPVAYFTSIGLAPLVRVCQRPKEAPASDLAAAIFLTGALAVGAWLADDSVWGAITADGPQLGFWAHASVWLIPRGLGILMMIAVAALALGTNAPALIGRGFYWGRWVIVPLLVWSARDAAFDSIQAVRARSGEAYWVPVRRMIAEARAMVNRFSTRDDLFFVARDNPVVLYRMLRRGFAEPPLMAAAQSQAFYAKRGVRFAMHYVEMGAPPPWLAAMPVIAKGDFCTLYCLDTFGCPELKPGAGH